MYMLFILKNFPKRKGNGCGFQTRGGHLLQQGLKLVIIVFINQYYLEKV